MKYNFKKKRSYRVRSSGIILLMILLGFACTYKTDKHATSYNPNNENRKQKESDSNSTKINKSVKGEFFNHGVAVPFATSRGTVATEDGKGDNLILTWLYDHRGTYSLLMINVDEEESHQFTLPFSGHSYTSILSSKGRYYTHFDGHFIEFSPAKKSFSFIGTTATGSAMSMAEDDKGNIWASLQPNCRLISYNPNTRELTDHGIMYGSPSRQLPTSMAVDDSGWIYMVAGPPGKERIVAYNSSTQHRRVLLDKAQKNIRLIGNEGNVFAKWENKIKVELNQGQRKESNTNDQKNIQAYITGNQSLFHRTFPDGERIEDWVSASSTGFLGKRKVTVKNTQTGQSREINFDYETEGPSIMGLATSSNGNIVGGTNFPMVFFQYNPETSKWQRHGAYGQFNTLEVQGSKLYIGSYPRGDLLVWDTTKDWVPTSEHDPVANPRHLAKAYPYIIRPHDLLAYPDDNHIIMAGRPKGGRTAGGLLLWNESTKKAKVLEELDGLANQSTQSLVSLSNSKILGGTTIKPGDSGGVRLAKQAELYIFDFKDKEVEWSAPIIKGAESYQDLCIIGNDIILGVADFDNFFVFDLRARKLLSQVNLQKSYGSIIPYTQGQRSFIKTPEGKIYLLLQKAILSINTKTYSISVLTDVPFNITGGGAYLNGRLYFTGKGRSNVFSYQLPTD